MGKVGVRLRNLSKEQSNFRQKISSRDGHIRNSTSFGDVQNESPNSFNSILQKQSKKCYGRYECIGFQRTKRKSQT